MTTKRICAMVLALCLMVSLVPASALPAFAEEPLAAPEIQTNEDANRMLVDVALINEDELPDLIWNEHFQRPEFVETTCGVWNLEKKAEFLLTYSDGTEATVGLLDFTAVTGFEAKAVYEINGIGSDNSVTFFMGAFEITCGLTVVESPVERIEIVSEPDPLVAGEHPAAVKIGDQLGIYSLFDACYTGLGFQVYYKDGTSELIYHEELDFGSYPEGTRNFYTFPEHNGYSVEVMFIPFDTGFDYWTGNKVTEDGVVPMYLHYMGQVVAFNATVVEAPVATLLFGPSDTVVNEGEEVHFFVGITGPNMTYQWHYRENADSEWYDLEGATAADLYLDGELRLNGYQFRCVGIDENGNAVCTDPATLQVLDVNRVQNYETYAVSDLVLGPDGIYRTPEDQIVYIGLNVSLNWLNGNTLKDYVDAYGDAYLDVTYWDELLELMDEDGYVVLTEQTLEYLVTTITGNPAWGETAEYAQYYLYYDKEPSPVNPFTDVPENKYYYTPIMWAYYNGITSGKTATTFEPDSTCTRAQVMTFLWAAAGRPEPTSLENPFTDVSENAYYYKAVLWAVEKGITSGTSATTFSPNASCTRNQVVTFLWVYCGRPEPTIDNPFTDVEAGKYYYKPILWAYENGITSGKTATTFEPHSPCTRGQIMTFLFQALAEK